MTALSFELDPVDVAVLAVLNDITNLDIHVGQAADLDGNAKTVGAPLPHLVYRSGLGFATSQRVGGWAGRAMGFSTYSVHGGFEGAKAVALAVRDYLDGRAVTIEGRERRIRLSDPTDEPDVRVDPEWTRTDGGALFWAIDEWRVTAG